MGVGDYGVLIGWALSHFSPVFCVTLDGEILGLGFL